jgi:glyoxylase-like metal-dependent hydrolase (beta-lactamase superfamily II)
MRIHALTTGTVRVKHAFLNPRNGVLRQVGLFTPGPFADPLPIHLWVIEHDGRRILVDTGELASANDVPFARFSVEPGEELPGALAAIGMQPADIDTTVVTHLHGDHVDGAVHLGDRPVLVHARELDFARSAASRIVQKVLRQPLPAARFEPIELDAGPFGSFAASRALTDDGRVLVVGTPGHTPGHVSVLCIDDHDHHVLLAGDATDTLEQLRARRADAVSPKAAVTVETIDRILAHGAQHPLVYLPSHDPDSAARLAACVTL